MRQAIQKNALILSAFAIACTALVGGVHLLTKDTIKLQEQQYLLNTLNQVIPPAQHDNDLYQDCVRLIGSQSNDFVELAYLATLEGQPSAAAITTRAPDGYNGNIELLVAMNYDGSVSGVRVLKHNETPGLGDKIEEKRSDWILSFNGRSVSQNDDPRWQVQKDGGVFDQFTGATITPRAVVKAVKDTALYFERNKDAMFTQFPACRDRNESL
ncbi:electron transport complex subunit RsxG [Thalassotalea agarivorans]|uniref:Ion-translocating oxidoreductase complex subunit G n=1 Tax=Thalassotalea agarivorans TaxID=349064 RepID=A0A1H9ZV31_THASX|nr:electron transport complex subunit RsxG [Thalassotalea agarivorans]SES85594.1 electron transport complex protein RnfG [Thalassotalea agarivorans]